MRLTSHPILASAVALSTVTGVAFAGVTAAGPADDPERPTGTVELRETFVREGAGPARVVVVRQPGAPARVRWATVPRTASPGEDFGASAGLVQFRPGERRRIIEVDVVADGRPEGAETLGVEIDVLPGLPGADQRAATTVTITD